MHTLARVAPHAAMYVDAAHGGWMGFESNAAAFTSLIASLDIIHLIRGFSTNVANYQVLGIESLCPREAFLDAGTKIHGATGGVAEWCKPKTDKNAGPRPASAAACPAWAA